MDNRNAQGESGMTKRLKIQGYVEIPDNMSAEDFYGEINGAAMFINAHDLNTFTLHLEDEEYAADVVEVVRCKDCKHCEHFYPEKQIGKEAREAYYCAIRKLTVSTNHFCSYGERREVCEKY